MTVSSGNIQIRYSGGTTNTSQASSLGGAMSTHAQGVVLSQGFSTPVNVTGVTIIDAYGNLTGSGVLRWDASTGKLGWMPPGEATYDERVVTANDYFSLGNEAHGFVEVSVTFASLPGSSQTDPITITNQANKTFDDITVGQALAGYTDYRCFFIKNSHTSVPIYDIRVWILMEPTGADTFYIAPDPTAKNLAALGPLVDEIDTSSVLSGFSWSQPSSQETGIQIGDLSAGEYRAFWIKRTIPAASSGSLQNDLSILGFSGLM